jgi:thermitase
MRDRRRRPRLVARHEPGSSGRRSFSGLARSLEDELQARRAGLERQLAWLDRAGWRFDRESKPERGAPRPRVVVSQAGRVRVRTGDLVVGLERGAEVRELLDVAAALRLRYVRPLWRSSPHHVVHVDDPSAVDDAIGALRDESAVRSADADDVEALEGRAVVPLTFAEQWHLRNVGQRFDHQEGYPGADVGALWAWRRAEGEGIRIAVIDAGFAPKNPSVHRALDSSSGAFRTNGRFRRGKSALSEDGHGAACAGMAACRRIAPGGGWGVARRARVQGIELPDGRPSLVAAAIVLAAVPRLVRPHLGARGSDVVSASFGPSSGPYHPPACVLDAIELATSRGRGGRGSAFFWALSNDSTTAIEDDDVATHPRVVGVGATDNRDAPSGFVTGRYVDCVAPGEFVPLTAVGPGQMRVPAGTSYATPCVAAVAALVLSRRRSLSREALEHHLFATCRKVGPLPYADVGHGLSRNDQFGHGRIDAAQALLLL